MSVALEGKEHPLIARLYELYPSLVEVLDQGKLADKRDKLEEAVEAKKLDARALHETVAKYPEPANDHDDSHIHACMDALSKQLGDRELAADFLALDAIEDMASGLMLAIADEYLGMGKEAILAQKSYREDLIHELKEEGGVGESQAVEFVRRFEKGVCDVAEKEFGLRRMEGHGG